MCVTHGAHIGMDVVDLEGACWEGLEAPVQARARPCRSWAPSRAVIPAGLEVPRGISSSVPVVVYSLSRVLLFSEPWTVAHQALLSVGFRRQEYWSGLPFPSPGDLPDPGI